MAPPEGLRSMGAPIVTLGDEPVRSIFVHEKRSFTNIWHSWFIQHDVTTTSIQIPVATMTGSSLKVASIRTQFQCPPMVKLESMPVGAACNWMES